MAKNSGSSVCRLEASGCGLVGLKREARNSGLSVWKQIYRFVVFRFQRKSMLAKIVV
jgi:hypothetical protein